MHVDMSPYEQQAWEDVQRWREKQANKKSLMPRPVRQRLQGAGQRLGDAWDRIPGNEEFEQLLFKAIQGGYDAVNDAAVGSINRDKILEKFRQQGTAVQKLPDIRSSDLAVVDALMPNWRTRYAVTSASTGIGSGFVAGGGSVAAAGGAVAGGVGAAPGVAAVATALGADVVASLALSARVASHYAAYHGFDTRRDDERAVMLGIISVASIRDTAAKQQAMMQVRQLAMMVARRATWKELNEEALVKLLQRLFANLSGRLTKQKLGQAIPVAGAAIGGGLNYSLLRGVGSAAAHLYREQFLLQKYDLDAGVEVPESWDDVEVVDAEVIEDHVADVDAIGPPPPVDSRGSHE